MGIYKKGILGPFSGTVGSVVGASFRGEDIMRSRPRKSNRAATALQFMQRSKFAKVIQFLTPAKSVLSLFYGAPSGVKSRFNLATSYHLQYAVVYANEESTVDYEKVMYAKGSLLAPQNLVCESLDEAKLQFNWIDNSGQAGTQPTDELMIVLVVEQTEDYEFFLKVASRNDEQLLLDVPTYLTGAEVQIYAFMAAVDQKSNSTSQYLGKFTIL